MALRYRGFFGGRPLALLRLPDRVDIRKVLRPARREFCSDQIVAGNEARLQAAGGVHNILDPARPRFIEFNARYRSENVNTDRFAAHTKKRARFREVGGREPSKRLAKLGQGRKNRLRILRVSLYQNVEVFGGARLRVNGDGVSADYKILNAVRVQDGQEFFEVWVHLGPRPSSHNVPE